MLTAFIILVVEVQFQSDVYSVDEALPMVAVCVLLSGEIESPINVTLISSSSTATSKFIY